MQSKINLVVILRFRNYALFKKEDVFGKRHNSQRIEIKFDHGY